MNCKRCNSEANHNLDFQCSSVNIIQDIVMNIARCNQCSQCIGVQMSDGWKPNQYFINNHAINGIHPATTIEDKIAHFILRQFLHYENELLGNQQLVFDVPDKRDIIMLLWSDGSAIGFFTLKPRGTWVQDTNEVYALTTLDTIYVHKNHRRKGFAQLMLQYLCTSKENEDIGFSKPISPAMTSALQKFLTENPEFRYKLWEVDGTGGEGYQKLLWFVLKT